MKLVYVRNQSKSMMGKAKFSLHAKIEVSQQEKDNIKKYKLGDTLLYTNMVERGSGILGAVSRKMAGTEFSVNDLVVGKEVEIQDITEMLALEEIVVEAATNFKLVLDAASSFGGQTVIEL